MKNLVDFGHRKMDLNEWTEFLTKNGCRLMTLKDLWGMLLGMEQKALDIVGNAMATEMTVHTSGTNTLVCGSAKYDGRWTLFYSQSRVYVPEYFNVPLSTVLSTSQGLVFLQNLTGSSDGWDDFTRKIDRLCHIPLGSVLISTPDMKSRRLYPARLVTLAYQSSKLYIGCGGYPGFPCTAVGVQL